MAEGIITTLKNKFNEAGNDKLLEIYEVQALYNEITNQENIDGGKVSMIIEPESIDSVSLANDIKSNIDINNELDNGPTKDFVGETFYNLDDELSIYNFDYSPDELQKSTIDEGNETKVVSSNDYNFSDISNEEAPEELTDVPTDDEN